MQHLRLPIYLVALLLVLAAGWRFSTKYSTAHAAATTVSYEATLASGCTANGGGGTCNMTLTWPDGGFADSNYLTICTYHLNVSVATPPNEGPYISSFGSGQPGQVLTLSQAPQTLTVTLYNGGGSAVKEQVINLGCIATHN